VRRRTKKGLSGIPRKGVQNGKKEDLPWHDAKKAFFPDKLLDELLGGSDAQTAFETNGLFDQLKTVLAERALNAEMDHHFSGDGGDGNSRNGYGKKTVLTDSRSIERNIPRDRQSSFDPLLFAKYQRRFFVTSQQLFNEFVVNWHSVVSL